jgi:hypothetical protein
MTMDEYEKLPVVDRKRFMECPKCREILRLEAVIRVYDDAGNLTQTHRHKGKLGSLKRNITQRW